MSSTGVRGEAVAGKGNGGLFEEEVSVKDNVSAIDWLRQKVRTRPMLIGELKPFWMRAVGLLPADVSQSLSLDELLAENFWRDADTNRWREPTDEERERMNDDRSTRVRHDAERYLAGSLRRDTLDVEVKSAVLLQELTQFHKRRLLEALRKALPGVTIGDLRFRAGAWTE